MKTWIKWTFKAFLIARLVPISAIACFVFYIASLGRMRYRGRLGHAMFVEVPNAPKKAITIGLVAFCQVPVNKSLIFHEYRHTLQWLIFGNSFCLIYPLASLWSRVKRGNWYQDNVFEVDARNYAQKLLSGRLQT